MTLMILPVCKSQWWGHSSTSIMRGVCWGNVQHARSRAGADETIALFMSPSASFHKVLLHRPAGFWMWAAGYSAGPIPPANAQWRDVDRPAAQPCTTIQYAVQTNRPEQLDCAAEGREMDESKHKQPGTSTAITGINKTHKGDSRKGSSYIRSKASVRQGAHEIQMLPK